MNNIIKMKTQNVEEPIINRRNLHPLLAALLLASVIPASTMAAGGNLRSDAETALRNLQSADSTLTNFFSNSAGYVVFPRMGKAGLDPSAEQGSGILYEKGKPMGKAVTEFNLGPQVDDEAFYEIIFFETARALDTFKNGSFEVNTNVNVVAAVEGGAMNAKYHDGVLIFTTPRSGLMANVTIGNQKFRFEPLNSIL